MLACTKVGCTRKVNSTSLFRKSKICAPQARRDYGLVASSAQIRKNLLRKVTDPEKDKTRNSKAAAKQNSQLLQELIPKKISKQFPSLFLGECCLSHIFFICVAPWRCCLGHQCHIEDFGDYHCLCQGKLQRGSRIPWIWEVGILLYIKAARVGTCYAAILYWEHATPSNFSKTETLMLG